MNSEFKKSKFITVLSCIFILLSGLMLIYTSAGMVMYIYMKIIFGANSFDALETLLQMYGISNDKSKPDFVYFIFDHIRITIFIEELIYIPAFISSIGLLMRKNWARLLFIMSLIFSFIYYSLLITFVAYCIPQVSKQRVTIIIIIFAVFVILLIKKLLSKSIKNEFNLKLI